MRTLLEKNATLFDAAAAASGAIPVAGRGTAYVVRIEPDAWLVRHYRRGGAIAGLLGDRYFPLNDRALHELHVSVAARAAGIATPEVVAAVKYGARVFSRFDIAVAYVEHTRDLADVLFGRDQVPDQEVLRAAQLIHGMIRGGLVHADLNLKNILVAPDRAYVIDLDRCRMVSGVSQSEAKRMRRRLLRSLEKWQSRTGRFVNDRHRRMLEESFYV